MPDKKLNITIYIFYVLLVLWGLGYWYAQTHFDVLIILLFPYFIGISLMLSIYLFTLKQKKKKYKIDAFIFLLPLLFYVGVLISRAIPSSAPSFEETIKNEYDHRLSDAEKEFITSEISFIDDGKILVFTIRIESGKLVEVVNEQQDSTKPHYLASQLNRILVELPEEIILNSKKADSVQIFGYWDTKSILNIAYKKNGETYRPWYPNTKLLLVAEAKNWTLNYMNNEKISLPFSANSNESHIVIVNQKAE
ncbi:hypothetical protein OMP38_19850 [Cohnella ginsengisoli]|uniref:Uncharacterized protein n=1 Tax=Cohnella ginsengisoli TaxID=425004 RepID=A0A9X4QN66_9BACL|nr:hypothetical protein [Cohnella ginsengisoli]MDG0792874.1 hypothetical protein [Cohnella ginsengisoli]